MHYLTDLHFFHLLSTAERGALFQVGAEVKAIDTLAETCSLYAYPRYFQGCIRVFKSLAALIFYGFNIGEVKEGQEGHASLSPISNVIIQIFGLITSGQIMSSL